MKFETYKAMHRVILPCQIPLLHFDRLQTVLMKAFLQINWCGLFYKKHRMLRFINTLNSSLKRILLAYGIFGKQGHGGGNFSSPEPHKSLSLSQDLRRPKAIMAIYMESQRLRIVSQFLWQHSSNKNSSPSSPASLCTLSHPLNSEFPLKMCQTT